MGVVHPVQFVAPAVAFPPRFGEKQDTRPPEFYEVADPCWVGMSTAGPAVVGRVLLDHRRAWLKEFAEIADASSPVIQAAPVTLEELLRRLGTEAETVSPDLSSEQSLAAIPVVEPVPGAVLWQVNGQSRGGYRGRGNPESRGGYRGHGEWGWRAGQRYRIRGRGGRQQRPRAEPEAGASAGSSPVPPQQVNQPRSGAQLGNLAGPPARPPAAQPISPAAQSLAALSLDPFNWGDILAAARTPPTQQRQGQLRQPAFPPEAGSVAPHPSDIPAPSVSANSPSVNSLNELAEDASILLELFSQSSHPNNNISDEHRNLITSAAASISAIQARVGQAEAPGNRRTRPRQEMEAGADCIICYAESADTVFMPCKHLVVCTVRIWRG